MEKVTTTTLAHKIAERYGIPKHQALNIVRTVLASIGRELLEGRRVALMRFGSFEPRIRAERTAVLNGQRYIVPERSYIRFRPSSDLIFYGNLITKFFTI